MSVRHARTTSARTTVLMITSCLVLGSAVTSIASTTCSRDAGTGTATLDITDPSPVATIQRTPQGVIQVGGVACGDATVANVSSFVVNDQRPSWTDVEIDLGHGGYPGIMFTINLTVEGPDELNDSLLVRGESDDTASGGSAGDTVRALTPSTLDLDEDGFADAQFFGAAHVKVEGLDGNDTLDLSAASPAAMTTVEGGAGEDVLTGGGLFSLLGGGPGADMLVGAPGRTDYARYAQSSAGVTIDLAAGSSSGGDADGDDFIEIDSVEGSPFRDVIYGDDADSFLTGGDGDDRINGRGGADFIQGGRGNDSLVGGEGDDTIRGGGLGVVGADGNDVIYGQGGGDDLQGGTGDDGISGGAGNDSIEGGAGNDRLYGGAGADQIHAGTGNDVAYGNAGDDLLRGDRGNDALVGGVGADSLYGNLGVDRLYGSEGNDRLFARDGARDARVDGGSGADRCSFDGSDPVVSC